MRGILILPAEEPCPFCTTGLPYAEDEERYTLYHGEAVLAWSGPMTAIDEWAMQRSWLDEIHRYEARPRQQSRIHP